MRYAGLFLLLAACAVHPGAGDDSQSDDDAGDTDDASVDDAAPPQDDGQTTQSDSGTTTQESTNVSIIVEPNGKDGSEVVSAITAAKTSVHMTMYLLSNTDVINALIARHKAGVDVKVLLDSSSTTDNGSVYNQLKSAGVGVAWSSTQFTFTHEKCVIIDGKTAWIMTMNLTQSSPTANREYLATDTTAADITEAESIFEGDFAGKPPASVSGALVVAPINAVTSIVNLIGTAKTTIDLEGEELSDYHTADALKAALGRGVKVRVVLSNETPTSSGDAAVAEVKGAGGKLVTVATPYIHAKTLVVDGATAYVGSENFSTGSLQYNRELGLIFSIASEVQKITTTISTDFSNGTAL
ncbi:MAG TPA: phospholipase D-like domain-containing protein [Polyangiaceae bacterium]|jgi:phosphatidylserine/phosphatidylglycerophosphate/cardiolipin synthase-like enzyme|nr:phospholipase D-like domain-containing protein [Polyangiaceae bacterium]